MEGKSDEWIREERSVDSRFCCERKARQHRSRIITYASSCLTHLARLRPSAVGKWSVATLYVQFCLVCELLTSATLSSDLPGTVHGAGELQPSALDVTATVRLWDQIGLDVFFESQ